ncbi:MAG TPA: hypothetical protein VH062_23140 [Polyangiaceae bacterium]|jgi:hypothetical protein|nr:hypothetical protein [Polyangiaceae bacterium]
MKRWLIALPLLSSLVGCTYSVHQIATGGLDPIPPGANVRPITADEDQHVILYITDDTDYADRAYAVLLARCPRGELHDIETRYSTSHGFLSFTNHLHATALCVE